MINNYIYYSDDPILTPDFCNKLITKFNNDKNKELGVCGHDPVKGPEVNRDVKQSTDLYINDKTKYFFETKTLNSALHLELKRYGDLLSDIAPTMIYPMFRKNAMVTGFNIQHTKPGEFFTWHSDDYYNPEDNNGYYRAISYLIYLNDVEEGGETEFIDGFKALPKQGHICFFPCTWSYVHRGCAPISNDKYIIAGWWLTDASMGSQRSLLTDAERENIEVADANMVEQLTTTLKAM